MAQFYQIDKENTSDIWLTPLSIIKSLGEFDLDPCCPNNLAWKTANKFYSLENGENGLELPWEGMFLLTNNVCHTNNAQNVNGHFRLTVSINDLIESLVFVLNANLAPKNTTDNENGIKENFILVKNGDNIANMGNKNALDVKRLIPPHWNSLPGKKNVLMDSNLGAEFAFENMLENSKKSEGTILFGEQELKSKDENILKVQKGKLLKNDRVLDVTIKEGKEIYFYPLIGLVKCGMNVKNDGNINVLAAEKAKNLLKNILFRYEIQPALELFQKICCHIVNHVIMGKNNQSPKDWIESFDISKVYPNSHYLIRITYPFRTYVNPPYSNWVPWLEKLKNHNNGIALIFARTETKGFFDHVWNDAHSILFIKRRVKFIKADQTSTGSSTAPSVLIAYGEYNTEKLRQSDIEGKLIILNN